MRTTLLVLPLLLAVGCSHRKATTPIPTEPLPPEAASLRRPGDSDYAARVRLELTRKQGALLACLPQTSEGDGLLDSARSEALYVSPGITYFPKHSDAPPLRAFEQCVVRLVDAWPPPLPVTTYEGVWVRFHFARGDGATTPSLSPLFVREGLRASLEVFGTSPFEGDADVTPSSPPMRAAPDSGEGMTRPVRLSGPSIQYSRPAIEHGVAGLMLVRCIITTEGLLETCRVLRTQPFMEAAVLNALTQTRYTPVTFKGEPMSVSYTFTLHLAPPRP
jgi:hypothetical protein